MGSTKIGRREFGLGLAAGAAALATGGSSRPNIVYVLLDDAGWGDLSCYGQQLFDTPNMDRLAREGIRFTDHYAGSTVCAPSRACLMTGLHSGHAPVRGNRSYRPEGQHPLPGDAVTMPRVLRDAGYRAGMFGKWGLGYPGSTGDPSLHFDEFFGYNCQSKAHDYYPDHLWRNNERIELDGKTYSHDLIFNQALQFMRESAVAPFFCYLPVTIPHAAMQVPDEEVQPFRERFRKYELTYGFYDSWPPARNPAARFAAMMTRLDRQVGELLELLISLGLDRDTVVMLSSDNGPHKEGGHLPDLFDSNGPFTGYKRDLYEGGIRVPMLARWPGRIAPGSETGHVSALWDVLPTLCEIGGASKPEGIDGLSFLPTLEGRHQVQPKHDYLYWEFHEQGGKQAARQDRWKAVRNKVSTNADAPIELYDLSKDPGETTDLARERPDVVARMKGIIGEAHVPNPDFRLFR